MRCSEIRKHLNIEPLLLRIERSQLRWFGHVSRMPQERLPKQALLAKANWRRPVGRPRTTWTNYIVDLGWNCLGLHPNEMMDVMENHEVWLLNLDLLPLQRSRKSGNEERRRRRQNVAIYKYISKYLTRKSIRPGNKLSIDRHRSANRWLPSTSLIVRV